jgi:Transglutaminase-like superfamily
MHFLSKDCFVCKMGCYWIILSASSDRYLCVAHAELASIGNRLSGWKDQSLESTHPSSPDATENSLLESLTSNRIITSNPELGKPFTESQYIVPKNCIDTPEPGGAANVSFRWIVRFFLACATVDWQLRSNALSHTLARIERRRRRAESSVASWNTEYASRLVAAFKVLRPLYPRPYLCLFESLALLEFLASYNCFPQVVFGVVADPFQAHCWLQKGSSILNDDLERVGRYRPILSA